MLRELTNLLPQSRARSFRRTYFLRLGSVALAMLAIVMLVQALLLLPTYWYAHGETERLSALLAASDAAAQNSEEQDLKKKTSLLRDVARHVVQRGSSAPVGSSALRAVLDVPRPGVALVGFTFSGPANGQPARMGISGVAASRDALRQYEAALRALPFVSQAELPISAYAKERDIPFTIVLTGSLRP
ncbi:MAG TPA: hypothetical protein VF696_02635 [Candidatus Paceibacterota bacterium]|jgi:Tfp pilus assembly protein PilN